MRKDMVVWIIVLYDVSKRPLSEFFKLDLFFKT